MNQLVDFYHYYFVPTNAHFWTGAIWGNLYASLIWALPTFGYTLYRVEKHHRKAEIHRRKIENHLGIKE